MLFSVISFFSESISLYHIKMKLFLLLYTNLWSFAIAVSKSEVLVKMLLRR